MRTFLTTGFDVVVAIPVVVGIVVAAGPAVVGSGPGTVGHGFAVVAGHALPERKNNHIKETER